MKPPMLLTGIALALLGAVAAQATRAADLYKWTDEKGRIHYTSSPPPETAKKPQQIDPANPGNTTALPTPAAAGGATNAPGVLFILDASGSMKAKIGNQEKMAIAKDVMTNLLRDLPDTIQVGLEVYGHHTKGDCNDIEVIAPVGQADKATLIQRIQSIDPKGMTPITQSLQVAAEQLKTAEQETTVVLVSDGEETCKGDPCAAVASLLQQGIKLKVHVVGFDVGDKEKQQLTCIAKAGNGKYFAANNAEQLKGALTEVKQEVVKKVEAPPPPPVVAQTPPPPPTPEKKVIKIASPGTIKIPNQLDDFIPVYEQQSNKKVGQVYYGNKFLQVPPGTYKLEFGEVYWEGIEVAPGETKEIRIGVIKIPNQLDDFIPVYEQQSNKKVGQVYHGKKFLQVPPGIYKLEFGEVYWEGIEVTSGETKEIRIGVIKIPNQPEQTPFIPVYEQQSNKKVGQVYYGKKFLQVPPGTYKLQADNLFTVENITVEAGQEVVIE
ncbi:MAG: VWA domain-containing protein [Candidatus Contendobacter sp.]|nr:MAG: VWA domain-containing protein [Candidatus Contendobacter sp.]